MKQNHSSAGYYFTWLVLGLVSGIIFLYWHGDLTPPKSAEKYTDSMQFSPAGFSGAITKAAPSVVSITTHTYVKEKTPVKGSNQQLLQRFLANGSPHAPVHRETSGGSGVIINPNGYILTNNHVVEHKDELIVRLSDGRMVNGILIGSDPETDLAVIKIDLDKLPSARLGHSKNLQVGDIVLAIGDPFGIGQTVTQGIISATGRTRVSQNVYENFLQTDAAINPGNSGGALINTKGEIIGINSNIYTHTGSYQGISFAIPIDMATKVFKQIIANGYVVRGWLGVEGQDLTPDVMRSINLKSMHGILITDVDTDGPGDRAGLKPGDIITKINQNEIYNTQDILNQVADGKPGDVFRIEGIRKRQSFITHATLGQRPLMSR